jgi:hypothetical protein
MRSIFVTRLRLKIYWVTAQKLFSEVSTSRYDKKAIY